MSSHSTPKTRGRSRNDLNTSDRELTKCVQCKAMFSHKDVNKHNNSICQSITNINDSNNALNKTDNWSQLFKQNFTFILDKTIYANVIKINLKGIYF